MKKTLSLIITFVVVQFFIGCAGTKPDIPTPQYSINKQDKVGLVIKSHNRMGHTHITGFSAFYKQYEKLLTKQQIRKILNTQVQAQLVELSDEKIQDIKDLIIPQDNKWTIGSKSLYKKYQSMGLKAILVVEEKPVYIYVPPTNFEVPTSGFASTKLMGMERFFGVSGYTYSLILLNPLAKREIDKIVQYEILRDPLVKSYEEKSKLSNIKDFKRLSKEELSTIENNLLRLTTKNIQMINEYLKN